MGDEALSMEVQAPFKTQAINLGPMVRGYSVVMAGTARQAALVQATGGRIDGELVRLFVQAEERGRHRRDVVPALTATHLVVLEDGSGEWPRRSLGDVKTQQVDEGEV